MAQEAETSFLQTWSQCCCCGATKVSRQLPMGSRRVAQPPLCALWRVLGVSGSLQPCVLLCAWNKSSPTAFVQFDVGSDKPNQTGPVLISSPFCGQNCMFQDIKADTSCWDSVWGWSRGPGMMCRRCSANPKGEGWDVPAHPLLQGWCKCVHMAVRMWYWQRYLL